jgi:hypothetical protein
LVILDLLMPNLAGWEVIRIVRAGRVLAATPSSCSLRRWSIPMRSWSSIRGGRALDTYSHNLSHKLELDAARPTCILTKSGAGSRLRVSS